MFVYTILTTHTIVCLVGKYMYSLVKNGVIKRFGYSNPLFINTTSLFGENLSKFSKISHVEVKGSLGKKNWQKKRDTNFTFLCFRNVMIS